MLVSATVFLSLSESDSCPRIISRNEWGARPPKSVSLMNLPVNITVIHHSVMGEGECFTQADCMKVMKEIQVFHMDGNGWDDIGYT